MINPNLMYYLLHRYLDENVSAQLRDQVPHFLLIFCSIQLLSFLLKVDSQNHLRITEHRLSDKKVLQLDKKYNLEITKLHQIFILVYLYHL